MILFVCTSCLQALLGVLTGLQQPLSRRIHLQLVPILCAAGLHPLLLQTWWFHTTHCALHAKSSHQSDELSIIVPHSMNLVHLVLSVYLPVLSQHVRYKSSHLLTLQPSLCPAAIFPSHALVSFFARTALHAHMYHVYSSGTPNGHLASAAATSPQGYCRLCNSSARHFASSVCHVHVIPKLVMTAERSSMHLLVYNSSFGLVLTSACLRLLYSQDIDAEQLPSTCIAHVQLKC